MTLLIDIVIPHPTAQSHISKALTPLGTATWAEKQKIKKHQKMAEDMGATLVPYAVETFGGVGSDAVTLSLSLIRFLSHCLIYSEYACFLFK